MRKLLLGLALALAACGGGGDSESLSEVEAALETTTTEATTTTVAPTTTTTVPPTTTTTLSEEELARIQHDEDVVLIKALWRGASDSWFQGFDAGTQYVVDNNHPIVGCPFEVFVWDAPAGYQEEYVLDADTIERDDAWEFSQSGDTPEGRIYIHQMTITYSSDEYPSESELIEAHTAVLDGRAYFFTTPDEDCSVQSDT